MMCVIDPFCGPLGSFDATEEQVENLVKGNLGALCMFVFDHLSFVLL